MPKSYRWTYIPIKEGKVTLPIILIHLFRCCLSLEEDTSRASLEDLLRRYTQQRSWSLLPDTGSQLPGFLLRDLGCKPGLLTTWSTYLVRTVSILWSINISSYFIRRKWRTIIAQHHPLLQHDREILAASWANECGETLSRSGGNWRLPAMSLKHKPQFNKNQKEWINKLKNPESRMI